MSDRIKPHHLARAAAVYIRQSSAEQIRQHSESTRLQAGLEARAIALGWPKPILIDEDLGRSAAGYVERTGFQRLLLGVAEREIGIILSLDATRLSRNSKDWAELLELCRHFDTLIADHEQVYDLDLSNDALIMGVRGALSQSELVTMRVRLLEGREAKAQRGELVFKLPPGYVHDIDSRIVFDPDQRVQQAIRLMFDQFERCGSLRQLALWYRDQQAQFPEKQGDETVWRIPSWQKLYGLLKNPLYTGTYAYGRRRTETVFEDGRLKKKVRSLPPEDWRVVIHDHHPAYISWEHFRSTWSRLMDNSSQRSDTEARGSARQGAALLSGLLRCRRCGRRLKVGYRRDWAHYYCHGGDKNTRRCVSFGSQEIDRRVSEELCRAVSPLAIEASRQAFDEDRQERQQHLDAARLAVQHAEHQAERRHRQFDQCDPSNRLVADSLESRWEESLRELKAARDRLSALLECDLELSAEEQARLDSLAANFSTTFELPETPVDLKKQLLRDAISEILVQLDEENQRLALVIHWQGGVHTHLSVTKKVLPRGGKADPSLVDLVRELARWHPDEDIARVLRLKKIETPRGLDWTRERVRSFRGSHQIPSQASENQNVSRAEAARMLGVHPATIARLKELGAISPQQVTDFAPWRIDPEELDSERVQELIATFKRTGRLPTKGGWQKTGAGLFDENKELTSET